MSKYKRVCKECDAVFVFGVPCKDPMIDNFRYPRNKEEADEWGEWFYLDYYEEDSMPKDEHLERTKCKGCHNIDWGISQKS